MFDVAAAAAAFPIVFLGELPDKTMFASLLLASRGRPLAVWFGASVAFTVHVAIAVTAGAAAFAFLPTRAVDAVVAATFLAAAAYSFAVRNRGGEDAHVGPVPSRARAMLSAAGVIFVAEWGDLTQIIIADLSARSSHPAAVGVGSLVALLAVAAIAVIGGSRLRRLRVRTVRVATAVVLLGLGLYELAVALGG